MFHGPIDAEFGDVLDMPSLLEVLAQFSSRPRYAFMVLNLIAQVAKADGSAGPTIIADGASVNLRDWLCDALTPMGQRDPRRIALQNKVHAELKNLGQLPKVEDEARSVVDDEVRSRLRSSGKTNVSRAVSELVKAGLLKRHYQGYRVDHHNRGAKRHAVYTLAEAARGLMRTPPRRPTPVARAAQGELLFG
ncbi:hypothetical protein SAMN05518849_11473 [Sphingobium sp. AP50]|uniref:hypothetical protein n=1 Tax=Sphingobium sp. AP50 TaxID=1884369 RepID=UPI0008AD82A4|nr:hypothetical protein [Sphingobium sp. AP50]SEJ81230.1 hypothetical protein SAMN05518849_11473 [Sphingobium sp. AP50]